jgi:GT2 family glycosyltransferase
LNATRALNVIEVAPPPLPVTAAENLPLVTVNILSYNRCQELRTTLTKITSSLDYPADRLEIIVVDNVSTDGSREMIRKEFPSVKLVENTINVGVSGWNEGFKRGRGDYFLVLDDDCYVEDAALKTAVAFAARHSADIVSFIVENPLRPGFVFNQMVNPGLLSFWGCAALLRRTLVERLGGYDPNIFYAHELEFTMRALDAGYSHLFCPSVKAQHMKQPVAQPNNTGREVLKRCAFYRGYVTAKLLPVAVFGRVAALTAVSYARSSWKRPLGVVGLTIAFFGGVLRGFKSRAPINRDLAKFYSENFIEFMPPVLGPHSQFQRAVERFIGVRQELYSLSAAKMLQFRTLNRAP